VATVLQGLVDNGVLAAFDNPARYLPSAAAQRARQESLPAPEELAARLAQALQELPLSAGKLAPFLADVERARGQPLLQPADLARTSFAMALDALLIERQGEGDTRWSAVLPLTAPANGVIDAARVRAALAAAALADTLLVDIKAETDRLYSGYLREAIALSLGGLAALILLLLWALRGVGRVARVVLPLAAAVLTVTAGLALAGQALTLLHLVGLLLVVAVGSNYALFFDRRDARATATTITPGTLASMLLANATTVAGFGLLAISKVSVLQAVGITVAPGVVLALLYAAIFADVQRE
jgi:predicted exporter